MFGLPHNAIVTFLTSKLPLVRCAINIVITFFLLPIPVDNITVNNSITALLVLLIIAVIFLLHVEFRSRSRHAVLVLAASLVVNTPHTMQSISFPWPSRSSVLKAILFFAVGVIFVVVIALDGCFFSLQLS